MKMRRVALVTGAAQGIGRRTAVELARRGYVVALNDLQPVHAVAAEIRVAGGDTSAMLADVADESAVVAMVDRVLDDYGHLDVLVNNAGISFQRRAEETSTEDWRRVLEVNLTAPFVLCREVGRHMLGRGSGSIVNVASIAGLYAVADRAAYNASKHGLVGLTRTLAVEWGGRGVRVNAVCPGWVKTEMDTLDQSRAGYTDEDIERRVPMARFATPDEIAQAVAFLADPKLSGFINGQCLTVDGGWTVDASWERLRLEHR